MDTVDTRSASVPEDGEKIIEIQLERLRTFKNHTKVWSIVDMRMTF